MQTRPSATGGIAPQVFVSYARRDDDAVRTMRADLVSSYVDCWMDTTNILAGQRLSPVIEDAIARSTMFFAYVTKHYLASAWCMDEIRFALRCPGVVTAPYVDSEATLDLVPTELKDELAFGTLSSDNYHRTILEVAGRAWASLQTVRQVVPADNHILAGPYIFDSAGYSRPELIARARKELIVAGPNLRSWMSDEDTKRDLVDLVKKRGVRVTFILATYETLRPIAPEGAVHLRGSARDIREMLDALDARERRLMSAYFHAGAATLSAVFIDPTTPEGILFFNPRWAIQFLPQDRLTCVIDKSINSESLFKAVYNGVLLMTQGDARTVDDMLTTDTYGGH